MLNKMIDHIEVHLAEKMNGVYVQKLTTYYNCIGSIEIPDVTALPEPDITHPPILGLQPLLSAVYLER